MERMLIDDEQFIRPLGEDVGIGELRQWNHLWHICDFKIEWARLRFIQRRHTLITGAPTMQVAFCTRKCWGNLFDAQVREGRLCKWGFTHLNLGFGHNLLDGAGIGDSALSSFGPNREWCIGLHR